MNRNDEIMMNRLSHTLYRLGISKRLRKLHNGTEIILNHDMGGGILIHVKGNLNISSHLMDDLEP